MEGRVGGILVSPLWLVAMGSSLPNSELAYEISQ